MRESGKWVSRGLRIFLGLLAYLFGLKISEGALDNLFRSAKPKLDSRNASILGRMHRSRLVCSGETSVRVDGKTCWDWVFQNDDVVFHAMRRSRAATIVGEVMDGHRLFLWVAELYGAQQNHADEWQVCLAHQLRDLKFAIEAGDAASAPRMLALLRRAVVLARRRHTLAASTRRQYLRRFDNHLDAIMALRKTTMASVCENDTAKSAAAYFHS
jgi:transposase